jgi:hypothetical protein
MRFRGLFGGGRAMVALGLALLAVVAGLAAVATRSGPGPAPPGGRLAPSPPAPSTLAQAGPWRKVLPGGRTRCARGGLFAFWARLAASDRLLVYFEGGGGCWDYRTCAPGSPLFKDRVSDDDNPAGRGAGILDLADRRNPFHDWSVLYVPSCTGDVYAGDASVTYRGAGGRSVTVQHRGHVNAEAALRWVFGQVPRPAQVFVAGCSAGSIGSILHAPRVIERYPEARVAQLGDSLGYLFSRPTDLRTLWGSQRTLPRWIPGVRAIPPGGFTMPRFYDAVAANYPEARFSQVNFAHDAVQRAYYREAGGRPQDFGRALLGNLKTIRAGASNFRSFLLDGSEHCTLPRGGFYSFRNGGVTVRDWIADLAAGRDVQNVPA